MKCYCRSKFKFYACSCRRLFIERDAFIRHRKRWSEHQFEGLFYLTESLQGEK